MIVYLNAKKLQLPVLTIDLYTNLLNSSVKRFLRINSEFEESSSPEGTSFIAALGSL